MAPQFYEVDVYADERHLADQTFRVVIDWNPEHAVYAERLLNAHITAAVTVGRALTDDPARYTLRAFAVDRNGRRERDQAWLWRSPIDPKEHPWHR